MAHAEARCKDKLIAAFRKPVLWCVGTHHGASCPQEFEVDLTTTCTFAALDHEQDVAVMCDMWVCAIAAMPRGPWSMGRRRRRRSALPPALRRLRATRCTAPMLRCRAAPCHMLNMPHYRGLRDVAV